ncbi:MAG TPA: CO dehydrogenase/acetyl-CoA synthase subunit delta [Candidatus Bathyarchaeia archaeon]|nr:CO dehydrogenase/acetyl-CoA synthase subunit delta [Candidatus Bathyarchaeia archaeon]
METEEEKQKKALLKFSPELFEALSKLQEVELEDVDFDVGDLEIWIQPSTVAPMHKAPSVPKKGKPTNIIDVDFIPPIETYPGRITEVQLGATKGEGGTRGKSVIIGGERSPPYYLFENPTPHPPVVTLDVFDMKIPLAKAVKMHVEEVIGDPAAWAKLAVDKFGADMITLHLVSTDPLLQDTTPKEAARTVENVLQAVDVPIVIGGCGDPKKDLLVFEKAAEVAAGERALISSVTLDMDIERSAQAVNKNGHVALAFTSMDLNHARELNRKLYEFLPPERIIMDTTTAALGYGLDYAFTIMERARLSALLGDTELQHPLSSGTTNAWAAREAWMKMAPEWGPRELRGPIWETITALTLCLAGVDVFMMMHPAAVKTLKEVVNKLTTGATRGKPEQIADWVTMKV